MISRECFVEAINDINKANDYSIDIYKLNEQYGVDGWIFGLDGIEPVLKVLNEVFNDVDDWIGYYVFELDFGSKYKEGCITDKNGKPIDISTTDKLYDFLVLNMQERD